MTRLNAVFMLAMLMWGCGGTYYQYEKAGVTPQQRN
jgi:hypothetical protein